MVLTISIDCIGCMWQTASTSMRQTRRSIYKKAPERTLTSTRLEPRDSISNNARAMIMMVLANPLLLQLQARVILAAGQAQRRDSSGRKKLVRRGRSHITLVEMSCGRHDIRASAADIAVRHKLREVEKALGSGARGCLGGNVMVMVVVIGLASHGSSSVDQRRGLWCRQQSHTCSRDSRRGPVCSPTMGQREDVCIYVYMYIYIYICVSE